MSISPQGYNMGSDPKNENPFWGSSPSPVIESRSIVSIIKTATVGLVDTYTITYTDNTTSSFTVTNGASGSTGNGISDIRKTGTVGNVDTYTIYFTNNTTFSFTVTNGNDGDPGEQGEPGISPEVSIETISGGHRLTITDVDHPSGQSFDIMDGTPGASGTTPEITITATQDGVTVPVTKTGAGATQNFAFVFPGGGGAPGDLVGWGPELVSTNHYPVIKNTKKTISEAYSESDIQLSGQLNDDQWNNIFFSGTCDVSIDADTVFNVSSSVKMAENDISGMIWTSSGGFEIDNVSITDNSGVWTLSNIQASVQYISDTGTFVTGLVISITCTATSGAVTKTVNGNVSISFGSFLEYTTATTYQNLVVVGQ